MALLGPDDTYREILEMAVGLEKDSVVFYVAIKDSVPESLGEANIDQIIQEEMAHIVLLSRVLSSLEQ